MDKELDHAMDMNVFHKPEPICQRDECSVKVYRENGDAEWVRPLNHFAATAKPNASNKLSKVNETFIHLDLDQIKFDKEKRFYCI